ncbi:hypothetical protein [Pseudoduganella sp. GCM10020061]|uniref:hypothetical protein n=1 Tax=Pseudoduganella sp. GCM10020061 TaxID=3317345 RepID=UPI0036434AD8
MMDIQDAVTRRSLRATVPLWLWAGHWSLCYVAVGALCLRDAWTPYAQPVLAGISALALAGAAYLLWRELRRLRGEPPQGLLDWALAGSAVLALAGIAWTSLPLLVLDGCR